MVAALLSLIFVPVIAWHVAAAWFPHYRWAITGTVFGGIAYPFFLGLSVPLLYAGFPIGLIASSVMLLHMAPGRELVVAIVEHRRLTDIETMWVYGLNGIHWAIVYGMIGWYLDRDPARKRTAIPLLLLAIPILFQLVPSSKQMVRDFAWNRSNPSGVVCFQLMDADPNARVWFDIGSPKIQPTRFGSVPLGSKPYCANYGLSMSPLTIQVYSATEANQRRRRAAEEDNPSKPLEFDVVAGGKTCIGIFQDRAASPPKWSTRLAECREAR